MGNIISDETDSGYESDISVPQYLDLEEDPQQEQERIANEYYIRVGQLYDAYVFSLDQLDLIYRQEKLFHTRKFRMKKIKKIKRANRRKAKIESRSNRKN